MAKQHEPMPLEESELPSLFRIADRGASRSKWLYFFLVGGELICICLAAIAKIFGQQFAPGIVGIFHIRVVEIPFQGDHISGKDLTNKIAEYAFPTLFLALAGIMYLTRLIKRYDKYWRARRALAEAVRELAWRFSMRAMVADMRTAVPLTPDESKQAFAVEFEILKTQGDKLQLGPPEGQEITKKIAALRGKGGSEQRGDYLRGRVQEAKQWYAERAGHYRIWMIIFQGARILAYVFGGVLIFFNTFGSYGLAAMTTIAGALGTWLVAKHYDDLSQSYAVVAGDLNYLHDSAPEVPPDSPSGGGDPGNSWVVFVDKIETILKGERQDWLRESKIGESAD
ncbi:MAG TPA: SLATT domain-containing protein [Ktedonobacterales bacterium]|jgi:hypothetical protein